jgi:hypothetical protein
MGILADLLANAASIDTSVPHEGGDRVTDRQIQAFIDTIGDPSTYPSGTGATAVNEVQEQAAHEAGVDGGTFTLTVTLYDGTSFTTAAIAFDAVAATIEAAIDTAADPKVQGFAAGDIAVTGGPGTTTPIVYTFDGASVAGKNHGLIVATSSLTDGGVPEATGAVTVTTAGRSSRIAIAALVVLGILNAADIQVQGDNTGYTAQNVRGKFPHQLSEDTVRDIIRQAAVEEKNAGLETALLTLLGY